MKVRLASKKDDKQISGLFEALDFEKDKPSDIRRIDEHIGKKECYVAESNDEIVAAMVLKLESMCYEIVSISSSARGGGQALIEFAIQKCKKEGIPKLWCWSLKRYGAEGFYKKMEFEESCLLKRQGFGEDCYFFGKAIDSD